MKRLIFVIQLMIVCNGLAMADPVISLKRGSIINTS